MKIIKNKNRSRLIGAALDKIQCDLSINNVYLVNVITGEIYPAHVDIIDGIIARVRKENETKVLKSKYEIDGLNGCLLPGFIDTHMHIESTMMIPENFGKAAVTWGTTTAVTDPHEIANVLGVDGVKFMLESAKNSPLRIFTLVPSCVPSVPAVEGAGASFTKNEVEDLLKEKNVIGIAEVMDYLGVINDDNRMHSIIDAGLNVNGFIQGHCPSLSGKELCAYLDGGPVSDHEVRQKDELIEKLRLGMHVNIKSSSLSDTVQEFIKGVKDIPIHDFVSLCTDDVHAADLLSTGHINHIVHECLKGGLNFIDTIRFGTINAARELNLEDIGVIAPGYVADLQLIRDLSFSTPPERVFVAGKEIKEISNVTITPNMNINSVKIPQITSIDNFGIRSEENNKHLIFSASRDNMKPNQPLIYEHFPVHDGKIAITNLNKYQYISVINRHGSGDMTTVVCSDFNLLHGCIASTISHDSHNMTIAYRHFYDAFIAAKELEKIGGGMCFVEDGQVKCSLPLPVAGLMSELPVKEIAEKISEMEKWVNYASENKSPMLLAIAILALPVRPGIIITDKGVVRGDDLSFVPSII